MAQVTLTRRAKITIVLVFIAVGLVGFYLGNPLQRFRADEEAACRDKCTTMQRSGRLVPTLPPGSVAQGKYDGPWSCECY